MIVSGTLLVRADSGPGIGAGHVVRCMALAGEWVARGGIAILAHTGHCEVSRAVAEAGGVVETLSSPPGSDADFAALSQLAKRIHPTWIVIDGYQFGADFLSRSRAVAPTLAIDDYGHAGTYDVDLVLNQNPSASPGLYGRTETGTDLLLGPRYALLRLQFRPWLGRRRSTNRAARRLLVTVGGDGGKDIEHALLALRLVRATPPLEIIAVTGSLARPIDPRALKGFPHRLRVIHDPPSMAELMGWADVAITAGGGTCWEAAFMGLPSLIGWRAENQRSTVEYLAATEVAISIGEFSRATPDVIAASIHRLMDSRIRASLSQRGQELVDGLGARRVVQRLSEQDMIS